MRISFVLIITSLLLFQCENKPTPVNIVESSQNIPPVKPFVTSNGKIYKSKTAFGLQFNNQFIVADRFSSWDYPHLNDTVMLDQYHYMTKIANGKDSEEVNLNRYYLPVRKGEQYRFPIEGKANVWLNGLTKMRLSYTAGLFSEIKLVKGEAYIEVMNDITIILGDSLRIECSKGCALGITNDSIEPYIVVSLAHGVAKVIGSYGKGVMNIKMQTPGKRVHISRIDATGWYDDVEVEGIGSWREAAEISVTNTSLPATMMAIDRWYNTITYYQDTIPDTQLNFTIPSRASLDEAIKVVNLIGPVKVKRRSDSLFVTPNYEWQE